MIANDILWTTKLIPTRGMAGCVQCPVAVRLRQMEKWVALITYLTFKIIKNLRFYYLKFDEKNKNQR